MPATTQHSEAEWARVKPIIETEYLTKNRSAKAVQEHLKELYGFDTTVRKLKLKFELWRWDKKTNARNYAAMSRVIQEVGNQVVFIVPKMGGRSSTRKEACKVLKEARRKDTTNLKKGKPAILSPDIAEAYHILEEAGIKIELVGTGPTQSTATSPTTTRDLAPARWQLQNGASTQLPIDISDDDDDDESTASDETPDDPDMIADTSRQLNLENFSPRFRFGHNSAEHAPTSLKAGVRQRSGVLPFESAFVADLHRTIFPQTPEYQLKGPTVGVVHVNQGSYSMTIDSAFDAMASPEVFGTNGTLELSEQQRVNYEKVLSVALQDYYRERDLDGQKRQVLEFSAYYVGQFLAGNETMDDYNHVDRQEARQKLRNMLASGGTQLLSHCFWLSHVVTSEDKNKQLLAFYEDCVDCIEDSESALARILQPWIRSVVLLNRNEYKEITTQSRRLQKNSLDALEQNFNATDGFAESIEFLRQYRHDDTHTYLILRAYRAWYLGYSGRIAEGLGELLEILPLAEKSFGRKHLVCINCHAMASRAYERLGINGLAENYVSQALALLTPRSRFLEATYYQLLLRLAKFQEADRKLEDARANFELAFNWRLKHFGAQQFLTWEAAKMLFVNLAHQGLGHEAQRRETELRALHDDEWKQNPSTYFHRT